MWLSSSLNVCTHIISSLISFVGRKDAFRAVYQIILSHKRVRLEINPPTAIKAAVKRSGTAIQMFFSLFPNYSMSVVHQWFPHVVHATRRTLYSSLFLTHVWLSFTGGECEWKPHCVRSHYSLSKAERSDYCRTIRHKTQGAPIQLAWYGCYLFSRWRAEQVFKQQDIIE